MKREDIALMEAKARAALEAIPESWRGVPVRSDRWEVDDGGQGADGGPLWSVETRAGWTLLQDMEGDLEKPVAEHIAASDPHAVLALIAELRRVEQELCEVAANGGRLVAALEAVRPMLRDVLRPYWDETSAARWGVSFPMTLAQARDLAAACEAVDPGPLRNAD